MNSQERIRLRVTRDNRKTLFICPYDHLVERMSNETVTPIHHVHNHVIYTLLEFKRIDKVREFLKKTQPLKTK